MEKRSLLQQIEDAAIMILNEKGADSQSKSVLLPTIIEKFKTLDSTINESTLSAYLSKLSRDGKSKIKSAGKKRGFFLDSLNLSAQNLYSGNQSTTSLGTSTAGAKVKEPRQQIEKKLYLLVKEWLSAEDYNAEITADKVSNGKWGNPDITGIRVTETVSESKEVEIITVEVKPSLDMWRQFIFEAVSHTRFANLSYYVFAYPENERGSIDSEIYLYAEEFGLGLLGIEMESTDYINFLENKYDPKFGDVEIVELQTPKLKLLRPFFREKFLRSLGIESLKDLILWASKPHPLKKSA